MAKNVCYLANNIGVKPSAWQNNRGVVFNCLCKFKRRPIHALYSNRMVSTLLIFQGSDLISSKLIWFEIFQQWVLMLGYLTVHSSPALCHKRRVASNQIRSDEMRSLPWKVIACKGSSVIPKNVDVGKYRVTKHNQIMTHAPTNDYEAQWNCLLQMSLGCKVGCRCFKKWDTCEFWQMSSNFDM